MEDLKLAILIDADNISPKYVKVILDEAANFGVAACKRIYGDWSDARLKSWKDALLNNSIIPIQQYSYTTGKNATDSAMIIDAMDLLYSGNLDGFCIVSSDSDFTRLAARLREAGKLVIGMGESKALGPFVKAFFRFFYVRIQSAPGLPGALVRCLCVICFRRSAAPQSGTGSSPAPRALHRPLALAPLRCGH